jgi:hypothetical protein
VASVARVVKTVNWDPASEEGQVGRGFKMRVNFAAEAVEETGTPH